MVTMGGVDAPWWEELTCLPCLSAVLPRVAWSHCCCLSCAWWWSCTLAGAGASAAGSPSPRRVPAPRRPTRFTTFLPCSSAGMGGRVCATPACRATTPAAPWASGRRPSWTATSTTSPTCATTCSGSAWTEGRTSPARSPAPSTPCRAATRRQEWTSRQVGDSVLISWL